MWLKILIIEDNDDIRNLIKEILLNEGYNCITASNGKEGLELFDSDKWDLVLLDLMLPEIDGYNILDYIIPSKVPVIIISALGQPDERINGLKRGADDYLSKPFQIGELVARVETVLRRCGKLVKKYTVNDVVVDVEAHLVTKAGNVIELTNKEFELLSLLIRNKNAALKRSYMYETVWETDYQGDTRTLDNHIQRIRKKLGLEDYIKTVFRIGYKLEERQ
ncbi:DNA-binding response regulator, OmpR family, contains REC and winged-helix (wHTH) domain [Eubacterium ruminantium]|nr:DNA-binding response regulator, OmpR family, contains REC and winged-helix (wHTH) domain [Eubacterium ruminantium]